MQHRDHRRTEKYQYQNPEDERCKENSLSYIHDGIEVSYMYESDPDPADELAYYPKTSPTTPEVLHEMKQFSSYGPSQVVKKKNGSACGINQDFCNNYLEKAEGDTYSHIERMNQTTKELSIQDVCGEYEYEYEEPSTIKCRKLKKDLSYDQCSEKDGLTDYQEIKEQRIAQNQKYRNHRSSRSVRREQAQEDSEDGYITPRNNDCDQKDYHQEDDFHKTSTNCRRRSMSRSKGHIDTLYNKLNDQDEDLPAEKDNPTSVHQGACYTFYEPVFIPQNAELKLKNHKYSSPFIQMRRSIDLDDRCKIKPSIEQNQEVIEIPIDQPKQRDKKKKNKKKRSLYRGSPPHLGEVEEDPKPSSTPRLGRNSNYDDRNTPVKLNLATRATIDRIEEERKHIKFDNKEDQIQYDLQKMKKVIYLESFNSFPPDSDLYESTEQAIYKLRDLVDTLEQDYSCHKWSNVNTLFKAERKIDDCIQEYRYNYRVNTYFNQLKEILKFKIDQQWMSKSGVSLFKSIEKKNTKASIQVSSKKEDSKECINIINDASNPKGTSPPTSQDAQVPTTAKLSSKLSSKTCPKNLKISKKKIKLCKSSKLKKLNRAIVGSSCGKFVKIKKSDLQVENNVSNVSSAGVEFSVSYNCGNEGSPGASQKVSNILEGIEDSQESLKTEEIRENRIVQCEGIEILGEKKQEPERKGSIGSETGSTDSNAKKSV
ncbi:unnamed protein product [Moneuplotes crassus]|uniref:Uncharacterized protein n=1 Tax=Euplotes crassus TaxID=5936 RepID=A0AAD1X5U9_EUPCR|nr:unnamed protein product [Moneuplotes crassus]